MQYLGALCFILPSLIVLTNFPLITEPLNLYHFPLSCLLIHYSDINPAALGWSWLKSETCKSLRQIALGESYYSLSLPINYL